jgi:hypothetical protein
MDFISYQVITKNHTKGKIDVIKRKQNTRHLTEAQLDSENIFFNLSFLFKIASSNCLKLKAREKIVKLCRQKFIVK